MALYLSMFVRRARACYSLLLGLTWVPLFLLALLAIRPASSRLEAAPALVTFTVNSQLDQIDADIGDGLCLTAAGTCTLRAAVMQANATSGEGTQINLPAGTYTLTRPAAGDNDPESGDLNLIKPASGDPVIHIVGESAATTTIDANSLDRAFAVEGGRAATISGVTIENGYRENLDGPAEGGAIVNIGRLTVAACVIRDNTATGLKAEGGGIANGGRLAIVNCEISGNAAEGDSASGGGVYNFGHLEVSGSLIEGNWTAGNTYFGGGIMSDGNQSVVTVTDSAIRDNTSQYGGGIFNALGGLVLTGSVVNDNTAAVGGGIYLDLGAGDIVDSTISDNNASSAGGVYGSTTTNVLRSTISGNGGDGPFARGGGFINREGGVLTITASTISSNASRAAGGIYNAGSMFLVNSTLSLNDAFDIGGGVYNDGTANVYNTTIFANQADADLDFIGDSGGVFSRAGATFNLRNTLLAGNYRSGAPEYDECGGFITSYGVNLIGIETLDGDSVNCAVDESFGPWAFLNDLSTIDGLANNGGPTATHALLPGSNAIDGGDPDNGCVDFNALPLATDQRGAARVQGDHCDIGAFEYGELPEEESLWLYLPAVMR